MPWICSGRKGNSTCRKNHDGYWRAKDVLAQFEEKAVPLFEALHPDKEFIFVFDNSTNQGSRAEDALIVSKMNMGPGGQQPLMREGWYFQNEEKFIQSMVLQDGKTPKGIKMISEGSREVPRRND